MEEVVEVLGYLVLVVEDLVVCVWVELVCVEVLFKDLVCDGDVWGVL
jgi:hypothetical protein